MTYRRIECLIGNGAGVPAPKRDLGIITIRNEKAGNMLVKRSPGWYAALTHAILEATLEPCPHPLIQSVSVLTQSPRLFKRTEESG